jgi:hypothetical protein
MGKNGESLVFFPHDVQDPSVADAVSDISDVFKDVSGFMAAPHSQVGAKNYTYPLVN